MAIFTLSLGEFAHADFISGTLTTVPADARVTF